MKNVARLAFLILVLATTVDAQTSGVEPGDRIRFRTDSSKSFQVAYVARLTADSLALESCETRICARLIYARSEVNHLDVYRASNRGDRAVSGTIFGALIGGAVGYLSYRSCHGNVDACELDALEVPAGVLLGAVFGGLVGFLTGYSWQPVAAGGS